MLRQLPDQSRNDPGLRHVGRRECRDINNHSRLTPIRFPIRFGRVCGQLRDYSCVVGGSIWSWAS
jgi:hypothetical protein